MSLNISLIFSRFINTEMMSLVAFKELAKEFKAEIIIIISENIKR